jgi:hypothetical protein
MLTKKKIFLLVFAILAFVVWAFPGNAYASELSEIEEANEILRNPENYSEYLKNYSVEDALKAGVDPEYAETASEDALEQLNEFQLLDYNQQMEFLDSMKQPFESSEEIITEEPSVQQYQARAASNSRTVSHTSTLSSFGINWTTYRVTGTYTYNSTGALKAGTTSGIVVRNLNPLVKTSRTSSYGSISNKKYSGVATFSYKIGPLKGLSVQIGTYNLKVTGGKNGLISGSAWKN